MALDGERKMKQQTVLSIERANRIAGVFVIAALAIMAVALVAAGRIQGWFEPTFELRVMFNSEEGSYGLVEGSEVRIRNTKAGKVGRILPTEDGNLQTTLVILERFRPFVTTGSVAKVKMKFGIAGDSYVDITRGSGPPLKDDDTIPCVKDEEIAETARRLLEEARKVAIPMLDEVQGILKNVNGILGSVEKGEGVAGAIVKDQSMAADVKAAVAQSDDLMTSAVTVAKELDVAVRKAQDLISSASGAAQDARSAIRNADVLITASTDTMEQTTRLVKGFQRHWLIRKYVPPQISHPATPASAGTISAGSMKRWEDALRKSRIADDSAGIALAACNLAAACLSSGDTERASALIQEAKSETPVSPDLAMAISLLEAELAARTNDIERSLEILKKAQPRRGEQVAPDINAERLAAIVAGSCGLNRLDDARRALDELAKLAKAASSPLARAAARQAEGNLFLVQGKHAEAAASFSEEAGLLREAAAYERMADALGQAARCMETAGNGKSAADLWFRAGRSNWAAGDFSEAECAFSNAMRTALAAGVADMPERIASVTNNFMRSTSEGMNQ